MYSTTSKYHIFKSDSGNTGKYTVHTCSWDLYWYVSTERWPDITGKCGDQLNQRKNISFVFTVNLILPSLFILYSYNAFNFGKTKLVSRTLEECFQDIFHIVKLVSFFLRMMLNNNTVLIKSSSATHDPL